MICRGTRLLLIASASITLAVLPCPASAQRPIHATVCAITRHPKAYAGKIVTLRATYLSGMEASIILDQGESCRGLWFEFARKPDVPIQLSDAALQRRHPVFPVDNADMKKFDDAIRARFYPLDESTFYVGGTHRYTVTATMTGRIDFSKFGFGMGGWPIRFVLRSVKDISTQERDFSPYEFSREPVQHHEAVPLPHPTLCEGSQAWICKPIPPPSQSIENFSPR
jgi:hypothetical protein